MNVLEEILEEIEEIRDIMKTPVYENCFGGECESGDCIVCVCEKIMKIIHTHMNNLQDAGAEEKSILCTVGEDGVLTPYDDTCDVIIHCSNKEDQNRTIELIKNFNWIPVSERLPEVPEGTEDDDCPEFNVTIKGADKATTLKYAPDGTWFDDYGEVYKVIAWKPLPEPYKEGE